MSNLIINGHLIDTPIIEILNQLKRELPNGKLSKIQVRGEDIRITCPVHSDGLESHPSCDVYCGTRDDIEYGTWHCFTCGAKGRLSSLIAKCFDREDEFGEEWLLEHYGDTLVERELCLQPIELNSSIEKFSMSSKVLDTMQSYHPYMTKRKLTEKVINTFEIKYDNDTKCLVFPVKDEYGNLSFLTRRSVVDKKFIIDEGIEKPIYLLYYIKQHNIKEVTICESQINTLTLWGYGVPSVATFGCNVTSHQLGLLNKSGVTHFYLAYDGDSAGRKGTYKLIKGLSKDKFIDVLILPKGKDINDLSEDEFNKLKIVDSQQWLKEYYYASK